MALMVPAHAGLENGHALSQPWMNSRCETYGVTGTPHHRTHLRTASTDTAPRGTTAGLLHHLKPFRHLDEANYRT